MSVISRYYTYELKGDKKNAELSIKIGNGQSAVTSLYLNGKLVGNNIKDSLSAHAISSGNDTLPGKLLDISTTIFDINTNNDQVSFRIKLKGGTSVFYPAADTLKVSQGGTAYFLIKVVFL